MSTQPLLYTFKHYSYLEEEMRALFKNNLKEDCPFQEAHFALARFPNGELHVHLPSSPKDRDVFVLGSIAPPEVDLFSYLILCHTLHKEGAAKVTALLPYLAYARHDRDEPLNSRVAALLGGLFKAAFAQEVVTLDLHSQIVHSLFPLPIRSISPAKLFVKEIEKLSSQDICFVAPDKGAEQRAHEVSALFDDSTNSVHHVAIVTKKRTQQGVTHYGLQGVVAPHAVIIDDILDTGQTLLSCVKLLRNAGVQESSVMVTHGLFTGVLWKELFDYGVKKIYCTNSVPLRREVQADPRIQVLSLAELLLEEVK